MSTRRAADVSKAAIALAYMTAGRGIDGILAYSRHLAEEMNRGGRLSAHLVLGRSRGDWTVDGRSPAQRLRDVVAGGDGLLLQYNPFSYGRWGFAPWLPRELAAARARGVRVAITVHEAFVRPMTPRQRLLLAWQQAQLRAVLRVADVVFTSTLGMVEVVHEFAPGVPVKCVPVGSNVPDGRAGRRGMRDRLDIADDDVALVAFGTGHPSQLSTWVAAAARTAAADASSIVVLNLGAGAPALGDVPNAVRVLSPGLLPAHELAEWLAAGDIFLAPFSDGASTRRTTLMAALQHGLPVVATRGANTDAVLVESTGALRLVDADGPDEMAGTAAHLAADPQARRALGEAGRRLYEERFSWPVIASEVTGTLAEVWAARL